MKEKAAHIVLITAVIISVLISVYSLKKADKAESRAIQDERDYGLLKLAEIIRNSMPISEDAFQKAVSIRYKIYKQVPLKNTPKGFSFMDIEYSFLKSLRDEEVGHICGGLAATYVTALESQGIPARYVGIFSKDKEPYDSHATVEFWYDGKWYASDPTFNVMFRSQGKYLSYSQLYSLIHKGGKYEIVSNGFPIMPNRAIEDYYIKLDDLMVYMVIHPSNIWSNGERFSFSMKLFPEDWDGAITYKDGKRKDVRNFGGIYKYLSEGPLR